MRNLLGRLTLLTSAALLFGVVPASAQVLVDSPTTSWTPIVYPSVNPDFPTDEQATSLDADLVGDADNPSFYKAFWDGGTTADETDGQIAFRLRTAGDKSPSGFKGAAYVGIDVSGDGSLDLFVGAVDQGAIAEVGIWSAGTGLNTAPNNTTIENPTVYSEAFSSSNYNWISVDNTSDPGVTNTNLDGGSGGGANHTDHFLSFMIPFVELVEASKAFVGGGITENTVLAFVAATATQANSLNGDLNGVAKNYDGDTSWADLGIVSEPFTAQSTSPIPEPSGVLLLVAGGFAIAALRRR